MKGGVREAKQAGLPFGLGRWSWAGWEGKRKMEEGERVGLLGQNGWGGKVKVFHLLKRA